MDVSLVMYKADGQRRDFPMQGESVVVGRAKNCDLRIPLSQVSREHCCIEQREDGLYLRDLGSSNGTFHNQQRVQEAKLEAGDRVTIGPVHFMTVIDGQPSDEGGAPATVLPHEAGQDTEVSERGAGSEATESEPESEPQSNPQETGAPLADDADEGEALPLAEEEGGGEWPSENDILSELDGAAEENQQKTNGESEDDRPDQSGS